jgi:hypothetical protein
MSSAVGPDSPRSDVTTLKVVTRTVQAVKGAGYAGAMAGLAGGTSGAVLGRVA